MDRAWAKGIADKRQEDSVTSPSKEEVLSRLDVSDVISHLGITGQFRGRWLRSRRCATDDHAGDSFGISRDGRWHCFACDKGGDLLALIAMSEKLDLRANFPAVLELAAKIAGLESGDPWDALGKPPPKARPPLPPAMPLPERIALAKRRAAWVWDRLMRRMDAARERRDGRVMSVGDLYLEGRGVGQTAALTEDIRETPMRITMEEMAKSAELKSLAYLFAAPAIAVPVRGLDGHLVDIRVRRFEPREGQPKIVGMLGGVTAGPAEAGRPRQLVGCYGNPQNVDSDLVVIVEGLMDYLTALCVWPNACVLGAVEAGSLALVTAHAARQLAARDRESRMIIVEQADPPKLMRDGTTRLGAADASVNEDPNAATKVAIRLLGPRRVGWLMCGPQNLVAGQVGVDAKDLNDLIRLGVDAKALVVWETEIGQAA